MDRTRKLKINYIDYDEVLGPTRPYTEFARHLLLQQLVDERPELGRGLAFVDSRSILRNLGPEADKIELYGSFTVALQKKYGLPDDWADKRLHERFPELFRFIRGTTSLKPAEGIGPKLIQLQEEGYLNVIVTHNYREVVEVWLEQYRLSGLFEGRIVDRREVGDKTAPDTVIRLRKRFGTFEQENHFDDRVENLCWPHRHGGNCWLISPRRPAANCTSFHHHHPTLDDALGELLAA